MCGIVGFITRTEANPSDWQREQAQKRARWFKQALLFDTVRGEHSTGVMARDVDGRLDWYKNAVSGYEFITDPEFNSRYMESPHEFDVMVGHNRAATIGSITTDNAHPFEHGAVTLVHNGTLRNTKPLEFQHKSIEVDSELIAYNLSLTEPEDAGKVLSKLSGAFTLVWMDERDNSVNVVRNSERPLHLAASRDSRTLYFMSEGPMLDMVLTRNKIYYDGIYQLKAHQWLKFTDTSKELRPEVREVDPFFIPQSRAARRTTGWTQSTTTGTKRGGGDSTTTTDVAMMAAPNEDISLTVGGKTKVKHPKILAETLSWFDMSIEDHLEFGPDCFYSYPRSRHSTEPPKLPVGDVMGQVFVPFMGDYLQGRLVGVGQRLFEKYRDYDWTVRPVALTWEENEKGESEITVHCKFVKIGLTAEAEKTTMDHIEAVDKEDDPLALECEENENKCGTLVLGPDGYIDEGKWNELVSYGCCMCGLSISADEAHEIQWVGEYSRQPLCGNCVSASRIKT